MPNWTDEQLRAIEARGGNILLSAAAGSGKTTVLVERVLRLIANDGADISRMLVVTFTRAAASDMRAKLSRQLGERAAAGNARCREQLLKLDQANISTLHAFCADFLRVNFESAGVDPAFRILDDAMDTRLRDEALDAALEEAYGAGGDALLALDYGRGPKGVRAAAELLLKRMEDRPDPAAWLEQAAECSDAALSLWQDELKRDARRAIRTALVHVRHALALPGCPMNYQAAMRLDEQALTAMLALEDYDELYRALSDYRQASARGKKDPNADPDAVEAVKRLREAAKKAVGDTRLKDLPLLQARKDAVALGGEIRTLSGIVLRAAALYEEAKAGHSGLTYADLEHRTLRALADPAVAGSMRERYDYVFVDEYQDTSDIQEALVSALCRGDNRFMVGDVKQSIYRFRLAEPGLFLEKYDAYGRGEGGMLLPLTRNFRSRRGILDFVNMVFERVMTGGDAEITYDAMARLNPGRPDGDDGDGPDVDILLLDADAEPDAPEDDAVSAQGIARLQAMEREGVVIARTIKSMMAGDPSLRYRDFAILTRSKAAAFSAMMPVMLAHGIPAFADGQSGYYESLEIRWLLSMLRLIENARRDVELIAMLRSPVVGLSADALARIRIAYRTVPYVDAAAAYARDVDDDIARRLSVFFDQMDGWRLKAGSLGLGEFVRLVLDESGFYTYAGALPGGAQRQANLDQFVAGACGFDSEYSGSLTRFLFYTEHMRKRSDGDAAHLLGENDNVVRMMSVHKSKGLEFKVVFGAQLAKTYRTERSDAPLLTHRDLGVGMSYCDPELRTRRLTMPQAAIMARQKREDAAEEMRILYVLLTRAQQKLVLVGTVKDVERAMKRWQALSAAPVAAGSHLDLIMAARCGAEAEDAPLCSELRVIPAASVRLQAEAVANDGKALFERVMETPGDYADSDLEAQLAWRYPDPLAADRPLKLTASGLLREIEGPGQLPALVERPAFLSDDASRMTGAERGTAYHRCMQLLRLDALEGLSGDALTGAVARQLDDCANRRLLTDGQRQAVEPWRLSRFLESDVGRRLRAAAQVRKEWPFNAMLPIDEALTPQEAGHFGSGELLVQGTIDCCFVEDGEWVLLDYKTDRTDDMDALRAHYEKQLAVYALALERITGMKVKQRLLCLLESGGTLELGL
ncbi:MAG: UvrD-helicase domain-containing protein [Clostridia bacterium]|nr:UvrD-helicase domain-containing protein [Clostridia bacterium]